MLKTNCLKGEWDLKKDNGNKMTKNVFSDMIKDERKAPYDYHKLLKKMKTRREKNVIRHIIKDEKEHFKLLNKLRKARL